MPCSGCLKQFEELQNEVKHWKANHADLQNEVKHWKANHADLKQRLAFANQRPDLPVDRIPAYESMQRRVATLEKALRKVKKQLWRYNRWECVAELEDILKKNWS